MELSEIRRRDQVIRAYIEGRDWDSIGEYALKRQLVLESRRLLPDYPYVIDDEWDVEPGHTQHGRGDLIFTDGRGCFAVVEVKYIDLGGVNRTGSSRTKRTRNNRKRKKLREQAPKYLDCLAVKLGTAIRLEAYIFSNQNDLPQQLV
ncbi:MAG: hypothetical protein AAFR99_20675 [Cyanobacteria bacterium J06629_9]